jgi:chloramphenicol 3-O phosphotransferase
MNKGNIILLNGVSSAGKTTLAKAIQARMIEPYFLFGNDVFFDMLPDGLVDLDWPEAEFQAMFLLSRTARLFSDLGKHVILDTVLLSVMKNDPYRDLRETLAGYPVCFVRVVCPVQELARRERQRGDRDIGQAESQLPLLNPQDGYDLVLDTHAHSGEECAREISEWIARHMGTGVFAFHAGSAAAGWV